jgi:sugar phosphate isomerase/epimerase
VEEAHVFTLTGFADEISPDLDEQLDVLESENIRYLELRGVWDKNVLDLSDEEVGAIKAALDARGIGVSAIGSPIGKIRLDEPFDPHLERFRRALHLAQYFDCGYIRLFSFYPPSGEDIAAHRDGVLERMWALDEAAQGQDVILAHENERDIYGDIPERCVDLLTTLPCERWAAVFDPANFIYVGVRPFDRAYPLLEDFITYCHIKDATFEPLVTRPAGEGDAQIAELLTALARKGVSCFLSLEPHLTSGGQFRGFSGPERFREAARALKRVLAEVDAEWD